MSRVCCRWRDIASEPRLWKIVNLSTSELNIRTSATILQKLASSRIKFTRVLFLRGWSKLTDKGIEVSWLYGQIMFSTVGNVDCYIDHCIGWHSIDIVVNSRLTVDRLSTDWWSRGVDCRSIVNGQSDKPSAKYRSIFRQRTSTKYWLYVGGMSVNCRWYVSQLLVAYRSTVGRISVLC